MTGGLQYISWQWQIRYSPKMKCGDKDYLTLGQWYKSKWDTIRYDISKSDVVMNQDG